MPSQILHTLFGEDVISGLHSRLKERGGFGLLADKAMEKISAAYHDAFVLGCQGPDIFYHNRRTRPVGLEYGTLLHRRGYGIFSATLLKMSLPDPPPDEDDIRQGRREKGINALGVYALGFMTHAILDRFCHPYIVYKAEKGLYHPFFERIIDVLMLEELRRQKASSWDQQTLAKTCVNPPLGLKELIARALAAAFPERAKQDGKLGQRIDNTFADSASYYSSSDPAKTSMDAWGRLKQNTPVSRYFLSLVFPENLPPGIDFLNLRREPWYYPYCPPGQAAEPDERSFPDIYAGAAEAAIDSLEPCIAQYLSSGVFPIAEAARSIGNNSLSIHDGEGMPCAPNVTSHLPLSEVLDEQWRMRND